MASFYTPDYAEHAERLRASCHRFGYRHWIAPVECRGSWEKNCARKAEFIRMALLASDEDVLWLDADAVIEQRIEGALEFDEHIKDYDFAVYRDPVRGGKHRDGSRRRPMPEKLVTLEDLYPGWWLVRCIDPAQPPIIVRFVLSWANGKIIRVGSCPASAGGHAGYDTDGVYLQCRFMDNPWMWNFEPLSSLEAAHA